MSAILCLSTDHSNLIVLAYHKCKELGILPCLLIPESLQSAFEAILQPRISGNIDVRLIPNDTTEIHKSLFDHKHIVIFVEKSTIEIPHPFHHLCLSTKQSILSIASPTGFAVVKTFPGLFTNEICRELLQLTIPTFITEYNEQAFVWKGGLSHSKHITFKKQLTQVESITGVGSIIRIKPCTNWTTSEFLIQEWSRFCEGSNILLTLENPDYYLVINSTHEQVDPLRTIYFMMEPFGERLYADWIGKFPKLLFYGNHKYHLNNVEWHLSYSVPQLKSKSMAAGRIPGLCAIVSSRSADPGQKYRLELVQRLDQINLPFPFHIYGKCAEMKFRNYKGELPRISKELALEKYMYNLICENNEISNYITEKLYDGILTESFTFYRGAPNVTTYFHPSSFGHLSGDIDKDILLIIQSVQDNMYLKSLPYIREMKHRILSQWALPKRIESILELTNVLVFVRYPSEDVERTFRSDIEKQLSAQSFRYVSHGVLSEASKTSNISKEEIVLNIAQMSLHQEKGILFIEHHLVNDMLFQTLVNILHLREPDLFMLHPGIESGIQYIRLRGSEKMISNASNRHPLLSTITKCIFTV